jgi:hypothetical protein
MDLKASLSVAAELVFGLTVKTAVYIFFLAYFYSVGNSNNLRRRILQCMAGEIYIFLSGSFALFCTLTFSAK